MTMILAVSLASCQGKKEPEKIESSSAGAAQSEAASEAASEAGPAQSETSQGQSGSIDGEAEETFAIGDLIKLNDWEISIDGVEFKEEISTSPYLAFTPDEGNVYAEVAITVKNTGKESETFLPTISLENTKIKILYDGDYEYSASRLIGYEDDLHDKQLNPLTSVTGCIAFEVPSEVSSSDKPLTLVLTDDNVTLNVALR